MNKIRRDEYGQFAKARARKTRQQRRSVNSGSRNGHGQFAKAPSKKMLSAAWVAAILSLGLLWASTTMVEASFGAFRSCSTNNVLTVSNCGKQSLNLGDLILVGLFILAAALTLSLFTHAWRVTKKVLALA